MSNRRIRHLTSRLEAKRHQINNTITTDEHGRYLIHLRFNQLTLLQIQLNWHLDQHRARKAKLDHRRGGDGWYQGTPASHAVSRPTDPLHTQWISSTLTPHEYQHLVQRHWERRTFGVEAQAELDALELADLTIFPLRGDEYGTPSDWLRVASDIEDHFLYRECAPCGAD